MQERGSDPKNGGEAPEPLDEEVVLHMAKEAKTHLRKRARGLRASMPKSGIERRSRAIVTRLLGLPILQRARAVALFYPMEAKNEVDLRDLDASLRARGVKLGYPSIDPTTRIMTFRDPGDPSTMEVRGMLAAEPTHGAPEVTDLEVIVVPALLVDPRGYRIGYGAGFYDRTLPRYCPPAISVGVAFEFQVAAELPLGPHDVACDMIVTDTAIVRGGTEP